MGNPSALPTPTRQPVVVYRVDLARIARVHAAHAQSAEHAAALAWGEQARQRLQAASERRGEREMATTQQYLEQWLLRKIAAMPSDATVESMEGQQEGDEGVWRIVVSANNHQDIVAKIEWRTPFVQPLWIPDSEGVYRLHLNAEDIEPPPTGDVS